MTLTDKIQAQYFTLTASEKKVADYLLLVGSNIIFETMNEVKQKTHVGDATIIRLCQKLGFSGFSDLKIEVAKEDYQTTQPLESTRPYAKLEATLTKTITDTLALVDQKKLKQSVTLLSNAQHIYLFGVGGSALTSKELENMLLRVGIKAQAVTDPHYQAQTAAILNENDLVIALSLTGRTNDTLTALKLAKQNHAKSIAITTYLHSPIAQTADVVLQTAVDDFLNGGSVIGKVSQLLVGEVLVAEYEEQNHTTAVKMREKVVRAILDKREE